MCVCVCVCVLWFFLCSVSLLLLSDFLSNLLYSVLYINVIVHGFGEILKTTGKLIKCLIKRRLQPLGLVNMVMVDTIKYLC